MVLEAKFEICLAYASECIDLSTKRALNKAKSSFAKVVSIK